MFFSYILNRGWIDRSGKTSRIPSYNEITGSPPPSASASGSNAAPAAKKVKKEKKEKPVKPDEAVEDAGEEEDEEDESKRDPGQNDDEDDEYEYRADDFETAYNFRFEEAFVPFLVLPSVTAC